MWPSGRRKKLRKYAKQYQAVIVLGCKSAAETVRDSIGSTDCKVIEGMEAIGFTNARLKFRLPCKVSFEDCKIIPFSGRNKAENMLGVS